MKEPVSKREEFSKLRKKPDYIPDRRKSRIIALEGLYQLEFRKEEKEQIINLNWIDEKLSDYIKSYSKKLINGVLRYSDSMDIIIRKFARNYDGINKIDMIILKFSLYQLFFDDTLKQEIIIDEAIEISKSFSTGKSYKFINGLLDNVYKQYKKMDCDFYEYIESFNK